MQSLQYYREKYDMDYQCRQLAPEETVSKKREVKLDIKKLKKYLWKF